MHAAVRALRLAQIHQFTSSYASTIAWKSERRPQQQYLTERTLTKAAGIASGAIALVAAAAPAVPEPNAITFQPTDERGLRSVKMILHSASPHSIPMLQPSVGSSLNAGRKRITAPAPAPRNGASSIDTKLKKDRFDSHSAGASDAGEGEEKKEGEVDETETASEDDDYRPDGGFKKKKKKQGGNKKDGGRGVTFQSKSGRTLKQKHAEDEEGSVDATDDEYVSDASDSDDSGGGGGGARRRHRKKNEGPLELTNRSDTIKHACLVRQPEFRADSPCLLLFLLVFPSRSKLPLQCTMDLRKFFVLHIEKPFPSDGEKHALAKECGLLFKQISDW